jgi:hypothetical protein
MKLNKKTIAVSTTALVLVGGMSAFAYITTTGSGTSNVGTASTVPTLALSVPTAALDLVNGSNDYAILDVTGTNSSNASLTISALPNPTVTWTATDCVAGSYVVTNTGTAADSTTVLGLISDPTVTKKSAKVIGKVQVQFVEVAGEQKGCAGATLVVTP